VTANTEIAHEPPIKPYALKPGDRVGLVCPASRPLNPSAIARSVRIVEEMGFAPVLGKHAHEMHGFMAGTDHQRLDDLHQFFADQSIKGIFCLSGGYGSMRLLDKIDYGLIGVNPKVIVGSDENTAWLLSVFANCRLISFYGPNLTGLSSRAAFDDLKRAVTSEHVLPAFSTDSMPPQRDLQIDFAFAPVKGEAHGRLLGGNLTALVSLLGTRYLPHLAGTILFLEDINERNDILDRWMTSLFVSGQLAGVKGVAFGQFENCGPQHSENVLSLEDLLADPLRKLDKPCCFDLPIGQSPNCRYLPLGVHALFDSGRGWLEPTEPALLS
jgi:muramoyltetrapeptide carboxypeptidase